jgi:hypothetical protein
MKEELLIFSPIHNEIFVKNYHSTKIAWNDGSHIGDIDKIVNPIPAKKGKKIFYLYPSNQYVILEKYNIITHYVEIIKSIYNLYSIPFNICTYKKKEYICYKYVPFCQFNQKLNKKIITNDERIIHIFHWIIGMKGKISKIVTTSGDIYISKGSYIETNVFSKLQMKRCFSDFKFFNDTLSIFKDEKKLYKVRNLLEDKNYSWFYDINKRLNEYN